MQVKYSNIKHTRPLRKHHIQKVQKCKQFRQLQISNRARSKSKRDIYNTHSNTGMARSNNTSMQMFISYIENHSAEVTAGALHKSSTIFKAANS